MPEIAVSVRTWPAQTLLSLTGEAEPEAFAAMYVAALQDLHQQTETCKATVTGQDFGLYHAGAYLGGPLPVEVCLPVQWPGGLPVAVGGRVRLVSVPQQRVLAAVHPGDWRTFGVTFAALYHAAHGGGLSPSGSSYTLSAPEGTELGLFLN